MKNKVLIILLIISSSIVLQACYFLDHVIPDEYIHEEAIPADNVETFPRYTEYVKVYYMWDERSLIFYSEEQARQNLLNLNIPVYELSITYSYKRFGGSLYNEKLYHVALIHHSDLLKLKNTNWKYYSNYFPK